jgi:hypothetical protein
MSWKKRYASQEILDRFRRGFTNFYGTKDNPTGNTVTHKVEHKNGETKGKFTALDPNGRVLGYRIYAVVPNDRNIITMVGNDISNTSGHKGVGLAIDHATAKHCTKNGLGFTCTSAIEESTSRPEDPSLNSETYHKAVGRSGSFYVRHWPKELMGNIAQLSEGPQ